MTPKTQKPSRIHLLLGALSSFALLCQHSQATNFFTEQFLGYADGRLGDPGVGQTGSIPGWYTPQNAITVTNALGSLNGLDLGLYFSFGAKVMIRNTGLSNLTSAYNKFVGPGTFPPSTRTNIYYSFLYQFDDAGDVTADGIPIIGVSRENAAVSTATAFHWWLTAINAGSGNIQIGISKYLGVTNYAVTNITAGHTFFIVVRQQIMPSDFDIEDLWINPPMNSFGRGEESIPPPAATVCDVGEDTSTTGPGRFHIIPHANAELDELRIASTWAEVTVPYDTPALEITQQPADAIADRGGSASFQVAATSFGQLSYQWQFNGTNLEESAQFSGVTTTNLVISNVTPTNVGGYSVVVFSLGNFVTSRVAALGLKVIIQSQGDGSFRLLFAGRPDSTWRIQCTEDLNSPNWRDLTTLTADSLGNYDYVDWPTNAPARFYRSVAVGP